jgi:hypothetical protein
MAFDNCGHKFITDITNATHNKYIVSTCNCLIHIVQLSCYNQEYFLKVVLQPGVSDVHFWRLASDRKYSAKSAYECFFRINQICTLLKNVDDMGIS